MPARTNEFQELVTRIQRLLAPKGAKVTASAMVEVSGQGGTREIDILVEGKFGPFEMKVAVEAKDEGRKMDIVGFEQLIGKYLTHGGIKVNKVVVVSHRGFTSSVKQRAKSVGFELLTLAEAKIKDWSGATPGTLSFQFAPHICGVEFEPRYPALQGRRLLHAANVFCTHGKPFGSVNELAHSWMRQTSGKWMSLMRDEMQRRAAAGVADTFVKLEMPLSHHIVRLDGNDYPVTGIVVHVHATHSRCDMEASLVELESSESGKRTIQRFRGTLGKKVIELLVPEGAKSERIILRIGDACDSPTQVNTESSKRASKRRKNGR